MNTAIYHLVLPIDKPEQTEETLNKLREAARSKGKATLYTDTMFYGKESRPAFTNLMKDIKAGKYQTVICMSLDRWAADLKQLISSLSEIRARGMEFVCLQDTVDISFVDTISKFQKTLRTTKIKVSMQQAKAIGIEIGRKPTPPEQVARVIEVYLEDETQSVRGISKKVAGGAIPKSTVFKILTQYKQGLINKQGMPVRVA